MLQLTDKYINPRELIYQLPLIFQMLGAQKLVGVFLINTSGNILMQYGEENADVLMDKKKQKLATQCFHNGERGVPVAEEQLPWKQCLNGSAKPVSACFAVPMSNGAQWLHIESSAVPLHNGKELGGILVFFKDASESIKSDGYVNALCNMLEKQLGQIENSQREITMSADKKSVLDDLTPFAAFPTLTRATNAEPYPVLVVDDIPVNAQLLVKTLKKLGVESETANSCSNRLKAAGFQTVLRRGATS